MNDLPPPPPPGTVTPRYVYLLSRLRGRQITMEEATELFGIMQGMIRSAQQAAAVPPPPPDSATGSPPPRGTTTPSSSLASAIGENADWLLLLGLGAGAGLGAALVKRMSSGAPERPPTPPTKTAR